MTDSEFPSHYYEDPWIPSALEIEEWGSLVLAPSEAQYLILHAINVSNDLNTIEIRALRIIRDGDEQMDFIKLLNTLPSK